MTNIKNKVLCIIVLPICRSLIHTAKSLVKRTRKMSWKNTGFSILNKRKARAQIYSDKLYLAPSTISI